MKKYHLEIATTAIIISLLYILFGLICLFTQSLLISTLRPKKTGKESVNSFSFCMPSSPKCLVIFRIYMCIISLSLIRNLKSIYIALSHTDHTMFKMLSKMKSRGDRATIKLKNDYSTLATKLGFGHKPRKQQRARKCALDLLQLNNYYPYGYGNSSKNTLNFVNNNYQLIIKHNYNNQQNNEPINTYYNCDLLMILT